MLIAFGIVAYLAIGFCVTLIFAYAGYSDEGTDHFITILFWPIALSIGGAFYLSDKLEDLIDFIISK